MGDSQAILDAARDVQDPAMDEPYLPSVSPLSGFTGEIQPTQVSTMYKVGLAAVAFGMVLLTASYVSLIAFTAYGVYYHLTHHISLMAGSGGGFAKLAIYLGPAIAGGTLIFFMIKPFFAGKPEQPPKYSLTPQSDPVLFAFIARICELVKAPLPTRVDVDCEINASASFRRGLLSMHSNDVVLTIGLYPWPPV